MRGPARSRWRLAAPLGILAAAAAASWSWSRLQAMGDDRPSGGQVLYLPSGKHLKLMALGFPELLADAIYLWSIQFYAEFDGAERARYLEHVYGNVITELDPRYLDPYLIGALIMSLEAGDHEMALRLLDKGIAANPGQWILAFEAGFLCFDTLGDHARAARYFEKALYAPGAPSVIRRLRAEMYTRLGDKSTSLAHWEEVLQSARDDYVREVAWRHVHDLTIDVHLETLRAAVSAYRSRHGENPINLETLVKAGLLSSIPLDPEGTPYAYDRRTGEVTCRSGFKVYRKAGR